MLKVTPRGKDTKNTEEYSLDLRKIRIMEPKRHLEVSTEARREIQETLKCSKMAMWRALFLNLKTDLSRRIRKMAKDKGAIPMITLPEFETIHTYDGKMIQTFPNGGVITVDMKTEGCIVEKDAKIIREIDEIRISELERLQLEVAALK